MKKEKKKILVIDDFEPLLEEVIEFLSYEGYKTYSAADGAIGVQKAMQYIPDLIICDIEMPNMNGFEVFKTLEKIPATESIPFIFLTARAQVDDFKAGLKLGVDDYITKPLELDSLLISISKRLTKLDKIISKHQEKFDILLKNPLVGVFIFIENQFVVINEKLEKITGYTKSELNKLKLNNIIISDSESAISGLNSCLKNIHNSVQLKLSVLNKNKSAVFVELFAKHLKIQSQNAIIGSIVENNISNKMATKSDEPLAEFEKIVEYLISIGKEKTADDIINIKELISFDKITKAQKVKEKIQLTKRENEILALICEGLTNFEIAEKLFISNRTVDNHRANLLSKTDTKNTAALVAFAFKNRYITS